MHDMHEKNTPYSPKGYQKNTPYAGIFMMPPRGGITLISNFWDLFSDIYYFLANNSLFHIIIGGAPPIMMDISENYIIFLHHIQMDVVYF